MTVVPTLFVLYTSPTTPTAASFVVDITPAIRLGSISGLAGEAELGAVGEGNIVLDDPTSSIGYLSDGIVGLKSMAFVENAAPVGNRRLYSAYIGPRQYRRGTTEPSGTPSSLITGSAREIDVSLSDLNSFLSFRVFAPTAEDPTSDFVRPAETDLERVAALLTTVDFLSTTLFDIGYIPTTGGIALDANDYTGQRPADVLNDCAQASGRNFFVLYHEATGQLVLWYDKWNSDGTATLAYDSALRLTNVLSEKDDTVTFAADYNAMEVIDPSRVVSAVYLPFDNNTDSPAYRTLPSTANTFAWRDSIAPSVQVKTLAKANALADRYLIENSTEAARISCTVQLPREYATGIHEGMRLQVHFTHLPNVSSGFTWTRVLQRTIRQDVETPQYWWLDLELAPISASCPSATAAGYYPPNLSNVSAGTGNILYTHAGLAEVFVPTPGYVGDFHFGSYNVANAPSHSGFCDFFGDCTESYSRNIVVGDGTITCYTRQGPAPRTMRASLLHESAGTGVLDAGPVYFAAGDSVTFNVSTEGQTICTHWVDVTDLGDVCGGPIGVDGFTWLPL